MVKISFTLPEEKTIVATHILIFCPSTCQRCQYHGIKLHCRSVINSASSLTLACDARKRMIKASTLPENGDNRYKTMTLQQRATLNTKPNEKIMLF